MPAGQGLLPAAFGALVALAVAIWLGMGPGGLHFDPSTDALIAPEDLQADGPAAEELMMLLSADSGLHQEQLTAIDQITRQIEAAGQQAQVRALTTVQIPVDLADSVELVSIRDWLTSPPIQARIALDALLTHPLVIGRLVSENQQSAGVLVTLASELSPSEARDEAARLVDTARRATEATGLGFAATGTPLIAAAVTDGLRLQLQQSLPLLALAFVAVLLLAFLISAWTCSSEVTFPRCLRETS